MAAVRARKTPREPRAADAPTPPRPSVPRPRKKPHPPRVRLTHLEVRRGATLRLRIAIADDAMADVGDELGALLKKIAPGTRTSVVEAPQVQAALQSDFVIAQQHTGNDDAYHANLREHLAELINSLCDTALADTLEIARAEQARRGEGVN